MISFPLFANKRFSKIPFTVKCTTSLLITQVAEALNWKHKDDVNLVIKNIDGKIGLFMYKKEK